MLGRSLARSGQRVILLIATDQPLARRWQGCELRRWPRNPPGSLADGIFALGLLLHHRPSVVITSFQSSNVTLPLAWLIRVPARIAWHRSLSHQKPLDHTGPALGQRWHHRLKCVVYACATDVVAVSQAGRRDVINAYAVPAARCRAVFPTCRPDPRRHLPSPLPPQPAPGWHIACLGRLTPSKGIDTLLHALRLLQHRHPEAPLRLSLIGDGPARAALTALTRQLGLAPLVTFHGVQPQSTAFPLLQQTHVMALPIRTDPGPGVIPEALGLGLPVITCAVGGIAELFAEEPAVRLINPNDPAALADALEAVLSDPSLAATMAAEARRLFEIRFHLDHWVKAVHSWLHAQSLAPAPSRP